MSRAVASARVFSAATEADAVRRHRSNACTIVRFPMRATARLPRRARTAALVHDANADARRRFAIFAAARNTNDALRLASASSRRLVALFAALAAATRATSEARPGA